MKSKKNKNKNISNRIEDRALAITEQIGSVPSLIIHSAFFLLFFFLGLIGLDWNRLLLILTTVVSLEAIYLAIFIQLTVNRNTKSLAEVEEDIDEIQEDIDEIQEDIDEIEEDEREAEEHDHEHSAALQQIQNDLKTLASTIESLSKKKKKLP